MRSPEWVCAIEALDDTERFVAAAASARRRGLPVVVLKLGASETSGAIAVTHTASLVGDDAAYGALFDRLGIRRVHTLGELLDTLAVLCAVGPLRGDRLVSLSCSGGEAALVADRSRVRRLKFPPFARDHATRVASALAGRVAVTNPLDYHTFIWGDEDRLTACFGAVLGVGAQEPAAAPPARGRRGPEGRAPFDAAADPSDPAAEGLDSRGPEGRAPFDAALLVLDFPAEGLDRSRWWPTLKAFSEACTASGTPGVIAATMAENLPEEARAQAAELGLAACGDLDTALSSLEAAAAWGQQARMSGPVDGLLRPSPSSSSSPGTWSSSPRRGSYGPGPEAGAGSNRQPERPYGRGVTGDGDPGAAVLSEHEAKQRLAAAGIPVPGGVVVTADRAMAAAAEIGYPVVVKTTGPAHKTDTGGVAVGLDDPAEVDAAARRLAGGDGGAVMVEACVADAIAELLVSVRSTPPVGMLLTLGAGGTLAELLDDTASLLLPAPEKSVREALRSLRIWPVLAGHRGGPPASVDAVVATVCALDALVRDDRSIIEVEINPLMVTSHSAMAADALMLVVESEPSSLD